MACAQDIRSKFKAVAESQVIQVSNVVVGIEHCLALHLVCAKGSRSKFTAGDESRCRMLQLVLSILIPPIHLREI